MTETPIRQIILDTETTGFEHSAAENPDRMIEFAGLEMVNRQFTKNNLHLYIHPQRDINPDAIAVHGITLEKLESENAPVFAEVAQQIFDFIKGAELIIHNAKFDVGFLDAEFARVGLPKVKTICTVVDTLEMARDRYPGQKNSLDALCNRLGVDRSRRVLHGALIDCELLGEVYLAMTRGQFSLDAAFASDVAESSALPVIATTATLLPRPEYLKVQAASPEELAEHEEYLNQLDKAVDGSCIYRQTDSVSA
ncbi:DNA polymerase III subunit epsilon [Kingella kingae]|uniref:DNA polymerase III subunit epsilon n=1 Tax=Kingella kingae TaxID=504 RepID=UPI00040C8DB3|nr:DNA polymerase III subunit epsilon [Kingella kingae]MDK4527029.1 DNA polymerase III subunit epsilon [Kingella kingae]MDK4532706.1 DNA polymerase III subunit epsilon [Kingella kingae]MDK4536398.1 DNA polymerase III subunit epsilon [Kingella kingae]MDK4538906.1 DNA polymerase III subunit epsilon [Kingella kingae]MDK4547627.1 DNA polymerase III subunit epsilon [Kingella kingae]